MRSAVLYAECTLAVNSIFSMVCIMAIRSRSDVFQHDSTEGLGLPDVLLPDVLRDNELASQV